MLETPLASVPDLLDPRAGQAVEQASLSTGQALQVCRRMPGGRLVVLAAGQVIGLLAVERRGGSGVDVGWLGQPAPQMQAQAAEPPPEAAPPPAPAAPEAEEKRWINAQIEDHDPAEPLHMGESYTLALDVDSQLRAQAVGGAVLDYRFQAGEELVELTVQLASDDFEIHTEPQKLRVPRAGKSKNKARFEIEPKHAGEGIINVLFLKGGNFVQLLTLKLSTGAASQPAVLEMQTLGRPLDAAFVVQPRDLNLTILNTGAGFQVIMSGPVAATASLPLTLGEVEDMIAEVRRELNTIVNIRVGAQGAHVYQAAIDIPSQVDRVASQRLAQAGYRLYQRVFYGPAADAQANLLGDRLREMARQEKLKIQIFSQQFLLPWGVLYMADAYNPDQVDPELFLGLKHIIEHIPLQQNMRILSGSVASRPRLAVGLNVNADIDRDTGWPLAANQLSEWEKIGQRGVQVAVRHTRQAVVQALADSATADQILYFYCHAVSKTLAEGGGPDDSTLVLTGDERLTLKELNLLAPARQALPGAPLVFINACQSAELSPLFYDGFVPYFMAKGARGVIGTECDTPAVFAAEFARRFFAHFLAGKSLGQALLDLRREFYYDHHNLLGLLYALYCDGDTQVVPGL
jgi:hypothetical protein